MLNYLKYIFLIFGGLALMIGGFFAYNNATDLSHAWNNSAQLSYAEVVKDCSKNNDCYFTCFEQKFKKYLSGASLTGVSIGLKFAFNFLEQAKNQCQNMPSDLYRDLVISLDYLQVNNLAIDQAYRRYFGFKFMYGGFISSLRDFYQKANEFSDNLILGLEGEEGLAKLRDQKLQEELQQRLSAIKKRYLNVKNKAQTFVESEVARLTETPKDS